MNERDESRQGIRRKNSRNNSSRSGGSGGGSRNEQQASRAFQNGHIGAESATIKDTPRRHRPPKKTPASSEHGQREGQQQQQLQQQLRQRFFAGGSRRPFYSLSLSLSRFGFPRLAFAVCLSVSVFHSIAGAAVSFVILISSISISSSIIESSGSGSCSSCSSSNDSRPEEQLLRRWW